MEPGPISEPWASHSTLINLCLLRNKGPTSFSLRQEVLRTLVEIYAGLARNIYSVSGQWLRYKENQDGSLAQGTPSGDNVTNMVEVGGQKEFKHMIPCH